MVPSNWCAAASTKRVPGGSVEHALELLDLAALDVGEGALDPARSLRLLTLDPADEVVFPRGQPLLDLVQRAPALDGVRLQLSGRRGDCFFRRAPEIFAQPRDRGPLLLVGVPEAVCVALEPCL